MQANDWINEWTNVCVYMRLKCKQTKKMMKERMKIKFSFNLKYETTIPWYLSGINAYSNVYFEAIFYHVFHCD